MRKLLLVLFLTGLLLLSCSVGRKIYYKDIRVHRSVDAAQIARVYGHDSCWAEKGYVVCEERIYFWRKSK